MECNTVRYTLFTDPDVYRKRSNQMNIFQVVSYSSQKFEVKSIQEI